MLPVYTYYKKWEGKLVAILRIYAAKAIFILFCVCQDTENVHREM